VVAVPGSATEALADAAADAAMVARLLAIRQHQAQEAERTIARRHATHREHGDEQASPLADSSCEGPRSVASGKTEGSAESSDGNRSSSSADSPKPTAATDAAGASLTEEVHSEPWHGQARQGVSGTVPSALLPVRQATAPSAASIDDAAATLVAAKEADEKKRKEHRAAVERHQHVFIPGACEAYGLIGPSMVTLVKELANDLPISTQFIFKRTMMNAIASILARSRASGIYGTRYRRDNIMPH